MINLPNIAVILTVYIGVDEEKAFLETLEHVIPWEGDLTHSTILSIVNKNLRERCPHIHYHISSGDTLLQWIHKDLTDLNIVADYSLVYNAFLLADEGLGYTLALDKLINVPEGGSLCFRTLEPPLATRARIVWKKKQIFSRAASLFLRELRTISRCELIRKIRCA